MTTILVIFILTKLLERFIERFWMAHPAKSLIILSVALLYAIHSHNSELILEVVYIAITAINDDTYLG